MRHLPGKLLVIWDGLSAHRGLVVRDFIRAQGERLALEWLPGYAPELNPVEYIWGYGSSMSYPTSARAISPSSATRPAAPYAVCAAARYSFAPSGIRLSCR